MLAYTLLCSLLQERCDSVWLTEAVCTEVGRVASP